MKEAGSEYIRRFHPYRIFEHWANALTFTILVVTGLSQRFHDFATSQWIIIALGGIDMTRIIHRYTGIVFAVLTLQHILSASFGILFLKWQPSMIIHKKDFTDAIDNLRYYFGLSEHPAQCDRFDYKQKFEYWGVVIGGVLMVATGLALWHPTVVTQLLPGEFIPVSKALHTNEALLAFLVIIIWHIYNAIFSPEVFPIDTVMFTGKISRERMIHEHPVEYERRFGVPPQEVKHPAVESGSSTP
jgi:formate dehydrogenase gamma subunit